VKKDDALDCGGLVQGSIVELENNREYLIASHGFKAEKGRFPDPSPWRAVTSTREIPFLAGPQQRHTICGKHSGERSVKRTPKGRRAMRPTPIATLPNSGGPRPLDCRSGRAGPPESPPPGDHHESLGYFADRYGFKVTGTVIPASARGLTLGPATGAPIDSIQVNRHAGQSCSQRAPTRSWQNRCAETGIKVVTELYTHLDHGPKGPAPNYIEMMKTTTPWRSSTRSSRDRERIGSASMAVQ